MENLLYSLTTVAPLFLLGALGYMLRRIGMLTPGFLHELARFIYALSFPCAIMAGLLGVDLREIFFPLPVLLVCANTLAATGAAILMTPLFVRDQPIAASLAQGLLRQSRLAQSIPLLTLMYGAAGTAAGMVVQPFAAVLENTAAVFIFLVLIPSKEKAGRSLPQLVLTFLLNPMILGSVLGLAFAWFRWSPPAFLSTVVRSVGATAVPLALLMMGAGFDFNRFRKGLRYTLPVSLIHLILFPAIATLAGALLGLRGTMLAVIFLFTGSANAASGLALAKNMGGDGETAGQCLSLTTFLSAFTLVLGIFILRTLGLICTA